MNNSLFTNILLVVIATLLLVLVIQNGMRESSGYQRPQLSTHTAPQKRYTRPQAPKAPMGQEMFFAAVKAFPGGCEGKKILTNCSSPKAEEVKNEIRAYAKTGKRPREVFNFIVEKWGEEVLTDQARRIRNMRLKSE